MEPSALIPAAATKLGKEEEYSGVKISLGSNGCAGEGKILSVNGPEGVKIILSFRELALNSGLAGAGKASPRSSEVKENGSSST